MLNDYIIGHIRTIVPMLVGVALTWVGDELGIVDLGSLSPELSTGLVGVVSAIYYALVRLLAERWGWVGVLLGYNKAPAYTSHDRTTLAVTFTAIGLVAAFWMLSRYSGPDDPL